MNGDSQRRPVTGRAIRAGGLAAAATVVTGLLGRWGVAAAGDLLRLADTPMASPDAAIADVAAVFAFAAWAWLLLGAIAAVIQAVTQFPGRWVRRITPTCWRRFVLTTVGIGVLGAPAGLAQASPGDGSYATGPAPDRGSVAAQVIQGLPFPDRPFGQLPGTRLVSPPTTRSAAPARIVVRPGDSLWRIAQRHLGPRATDPAIATEWRRWYAANRACIGPNPDLIQPGMVLHAPAREAAS